MADDGVMGQGALSFRDIATRQRGAKDKFGADYVDLVAKNTPMLDDMVVVQANDGSVDRTTILTGLPKAVWVQQYQGIQSSKGSRQEIRNTAGMMGTKLEIAQSLYKRTKDKDQLILEEVEGHLEAMKQSMAAAVIYGDLKDDPRGFNGLLQHYSELCSSMSTTKDSSFYVLDGNTDGNTNGIDLGSLVLAGWSRRTLRAFYPEGSETGGLSKGALKTGVEIIDQVNGGTYEGVVQHMDWDLGLSLRDFRYCGRIPNINRATLFDADPENVRAKTITEILRRLNFRVREDNVKQAFYMERQMLEALDVFFARLTMGNAITVEHLEGRKTKTLWGIPIRVNDVMEAAEERVV